MKPIITNSNHFELFYPELSFTITGLLFKTHNELGPYAREKQYGNIFESKLKQISIPYQREQIISGNGNIVDFIIDNKIVLEFKVVRILRSEDYVQIQRYLQETQLKLGLLVNFRNKYIHPVRIVKIDKI